MVLLYSRTLTDSREVKKLKIFRDDIAYVQKGDLLFWMTQLLDVPMPTSLANAIFAMADSDHPSVVVVEGRSRYDFIPIYDSRGIEELKAVDWIDDFDIIDPMPDKDISKQRIHLAAQLNSKNRSLSTYGNDGQETVTEARIKCQTLHHRVNALGDYLSFRKGALIWNLPEGVKSVSAQKPTFTSRIRDFFKFI